MASEAGIEPARSSPGPGNSAGPLGAAMGASRSFGALYPASSRSYSPQVLSLPPLVAGVGSGPAPLQPSGSSTWPAQQTARQPGASSSQAQQPAGSGMSSSSSGPLHPAGSGAVAGAAAVAGACAGQQAASPAASPALIDLASPAMESQRFRQRQHAYNHQPTPQQLFASSPAPLVQAGTLQRGAGGSGAGWTAFGEQQPAQAATPLPRSPLQLEPAVGPLGSGALCSPLLRQASGLGVAGSPGSMEQQRQEQQALQQQAPAPVPQQRVERQLSQQREREQPAPQLAERRNVQPPQPPPYQQQFGAPSVLADGMIAGWATFGDSPAGGGRAGQTALPEAPCRSSIHSPLAQGMGTVHRLGSVGPLGSGPLASQAAMTPHRSTSGSSGTACSLQHSPLSVTRDAFAELTVLAAAEASDHIASSPRRRTSSAAGGPPHQQQPLGQGPPTAWRSTSTSSWAEFEGAPAADASNPFLQPSPRSLPRQLTAGSGRTTSWGDWSGPLPEANNCWAKPAGSQQEERRPAGGAGAAAAELSALRL